MSAKTCVVIEIQRNTPEVCKTASPFVGGAGSLRLAIDFIYGLAIVYSMVWLGNTKHVIDRQ